MKKTIKIAGANRQKRPFRVMTCFFLSALLVMLVGCAGGGSEDSATSPEMMSRESSDFDAANFAGTEAEVDGKFGASRTENQNTEDTAAKTAASAVDLRTSSNKIIYKGELSVGTKNVGELQNKIIKEVELIGGYVQSSYSEQSHAGLVVRVPQSRFFSFMDSEIFKGEEIERKNISSDDVTLQYSNMTAELESLRVQEERLLTYLKSAKNVKEMLEIETQLGQVRLSIKTAEESKKAMDSYINMSEVNISLYSRGENQVAATSFGTRVGYAFEDIGHQIKQNFQNLFLWCILIIPTLINLLILVAVVLVIYSQRRRFVVLGSKLPGIRRKKKKDEDSRL